LEEEKIEEVVNQILALNIIKDKLELEFDQIPEEIEKPMHSVRSSNCR
jgi:predicted ATP-grasp superfamily ATP-dependent carboligase